MWQQRETQKPVIKNRDFDQHAHHEALRQKFGKEFRSKIAFLDEYPEKKKELRKLKVELAKLLGVDADKWCFEREVEYQIKQLRIMADESERKLKIANELVSLKDTVASKIDRIIKNYTE